MPKSGDSQTLEEAAAAQEAPAAAFDGAALLSGSWLEYRTTVDHWL